jgi:hypothetical protein
MSYSSEYAINPLRRIVITEVAVVITLIHAAANPAEPSKPEQATVLSAPNLGGDTSWWLH